MKTSWPVLLNSRMVIEERLGPLQGLFIARGYEWKIAFFLAMIPLLLSGFIFWYYLTAPNPGQTWIGGSIALGVSVALFLLTCWYYRRRQYLCICDGGCASARSFGAEPAIMPWSQLQAIKVEEEDYLKTQEHEVFGVTVWKSMEEASRKWLLLETAEQVVRIKLKDYAKPEFLLEQLAKHTENKSVALDHQRVTSPELLKAKASHPDGKELKKTTYYTSGVLLAIFIGVAIFLIRFYLRKNR